MPESRQSKWELKKSEERREIGELPPVKDPARRAACADDPELFCNTYLAKRFYLPWSLDQRKVAASAYKIVREGGREAKVMPRGSGKTSLTMSLCLHGILYGRRRYMVIVGPTQQYAEKRLKSEFATTLETNKLLKEDFPEVCYPIAKLQRMQGRAHGQTYRGESTYISLLKNRIHLPWIPGAPSAGSIITAVGINGAIRGELFSLPDGSLLRPEMVFIDDIQTERSAKSELQCLERVEIVNGAILGLAGPDQDLAAFCCGTIMREGDAMSQLMDREISPEWQGAHYKMVYSFPKRMDLWEEYGQQRKDELRNGGDGSKANQFYAERQAEMDEGALLGWPERFKRGKELSGVHRAMNFFLVEPEKFACEGQGEPLAPAGVGDQLDPKEIVKRCNGTPRRTVPANAEFLTLGCDVGHHVLWYMLCAWTKNFDGWVVDYGTYPDQGRHYFTTKELQKLKTLRRVHQGAGKEGAILAGLKAMLDGKLLVEDFPTTGPPRKIVRALVDSGDLPDTVFDFCRQSTHSAVVMPSKGVYVGARNKPWSEYARKPGGQLGWHWEIPPIAQRRGNRVLNFDTNFFKSFVAQRLTTPVGDKTALTLFGKDGAGHRMLAEHLTAERFTETEGQGRKLEEWVQLPGRDNHWFDCLVMCAAAAAFHGAALPGTIVKAKAATGGYAEMQRQADARKAASQGSGGGGGYAEMFRQAESRRTAK